ncbi:MAG: hypothetical protein J5496_05075 [Lachnospiraceae bacterium]|nr:hypothetical protein [Lachnospiraceae bacterium]
MNNFDPVTGEPLTPEAKAARAAQSAGDYSAPTPAAPAPQPILQEEDLLQVNPMAATAPKQKKRSKVLPIAVGAAAVAVVAALVLLIVPLFKSPVRKLVNGAENTVKALCASPVGNTLTQLEKSGSATLSVDLSKNEELMQLLMRSDIKLDAKAEIAMFLKEKTGAALSIDTELNDKDLLDALVVGTKDELAVSSTALFSKTNYGVNLKNMAKNLKGSIFDPEEGTKYALPEEIFNALENLSLNDLEKLAEEGKTVLGKVFDQFVSSVEKNGKVSKGSEKITIGEKEISTSTVTVELDGKAIKKIATDVLDFLKKDKSVKTFINNIRQTAEKSSLSEFLGIDEEFADDFYNWVDEQRDAVDDWEEDLENVTVTLTGFLKGSQLLQAEVEYKENKEKSTLRVTVGPDPKNPAEITFYFKDPYGSKETLSYKVSVNDKSSYEASFSVKADSETPFKGKLVWDKKEGGLKLTAEVQRYSYYGGTSTSKYELKANMTQSGKKTVIALEKLTAGENTVSLKGISLTLDGGAKFPSISKYTDILTLDEDDFGDLIEDLQKSLQELTQSLGQSGSSSTSAVPVQGY